MTHQYFYRLMIYHAFYDHVAGFLHCDLTIITAGINSALYKPCSDNANYCVDWSPVYILSRI